MNEHLLSSEVQQFIRCYSEDTDTLAFAGSPFENVATRDLLQQIESRRKIKNKLPRWYDTDGILYPPKLNLEQTSSEETAEYKSRLVSGSIMADISGGYGLDSFFFSKKVLELDYFELNAELKEMAEHNLHVLGRDNINFHATDGLAGISGKRYDIVYADPSRRSDVKGKVYKLSDCVPDIPGNLDKLFAVTDKVLLKTSPMLDLDAGIKALEAVSEIHIVAVKNEVKEVLWLLESGQDSPIKVIAVNLKPNGEQVFSFQFSDIAAVNYSKPLNFLYEPNAAILKSGAFSLIAKQFNLFKLHKHTHLYTSNELIDFPGRRFRVIEIFPYSKKTMRSGITFEKANIATRNFPESVADLRRKWKITEGGDSYIFFVISGNDEKMVLICEKIKR